MKITTSGDAHKGRVFGLDLLRFIAIFFVMFTHAGHFFPFRQHINIYTSFVYDGVGIFFVLSGFLIGRILLRQLNNDNFNFKSLIKFWAQRWSRTLPNYYLFLILYLAVNVAILGHFDRHLYMPYFLFVQNIATTTPLFFGASWSLSVEEWFYLISPFAIFLTIRILKVSAKSSFLAVSVLLIIIVNALRFTHYYSHEPAYENYDNVRYGVIYRLDAIMYGMIGSYISFYFPLLWQRLKNPGIMFGCIAIATYYLSPLRNDIQYKTLLVFTLTSVSVLAFLPYLSGLKTTDRPIGKWITWVSLISYSLYLVNSLVIEVVANFINWDRIEDFVRNNISSEHSWGLIFTVNYFLFWIVSIAVSGIVYKYFELPSTTAIRQILSRDRKSKNKFATRAHK